ncbi:type II toxin-antitoxin system HicA family toxin [Candidatus Daviesbacteria bacterium]|nr:type II toxin-antitoxin system HicA family toxin [Candidatus Daviesbacteria bacterium]
MTKLFQVRPKDLVKALEKAGFTKNRQSGSHLYLKHPDGRLTSVSIHPKPVPTGTLRAILKQTQLKPDELKKLL